MERFSDNYIDSYEKKISIQQIYLMYQEKNCISHGSSDEEIREGRTCFRNRGDHSAGICLAGYLCIRAAGWESACFGDR